MTKKKKTSVTQKNIDKINRNLRSIAKTFGKTSKAYEEAATKAYLSGLDIYDRLVDGEYVIQIKNTAKNRKYHQKISNLAKSRKSIATLKRKYMPKDYEDPIFDHDAADASDSEPTETFEQWYSRISSEIFDFLDELYALMDSLDFLEIPYDENMVRLSPDYRESMWEQVFNALIADTKKAKDFYDTMGFGIADTGEVITEEINTDPAQNDQTSIFDESWFDDEYELRRNKRKRR